MLIYALTLLMTTKRKYSSKEDWDAPIFYSIKRGHKSLHHSMVRRTVKSLTLLIIIVFLVIRSSLFYNISFSTTYPKVILSPQLYDFFTVNIFPQSSHFTKGSAILQISKIRRTLAFYTFKPFTFTPLTSLLLSQRAWKQKQKILLASFISVSVNSISRHSSYIKNVDIKCSILPSVY